ncbi:MAG: fatty acid/phospholipid biosynthesis enzyme [Gammaproteobacteria bacterium]
MTIAVLVLIFNTLPPHVKQVEQAGDSAMLVRGKDRYQYYATDIGANADLDPQAMKHHAMLQQRYEEIASAK